VSLMSGQTVAHLSSMSCLFVADVSANCRGCVAGFVVDLARFAADSMVKIVTD
jgi:hypothetical protein